MLLVLVEGEWFNATWSLSQLTISLVLPGSPRGQILVQLVKVHLLKQLRKLI